MPIVLPRHKSLAHGGSDGFGQGERTAVGGNERVAGEVGRLENKWRTKTCKQGAAKVVDESGQAAYVSETVEETRISLQTGGNDGLNKERHCSSG